MDCRGSGAYTREQEVCVERRRPRIARGSDAHRVFDTTDEALEIV